MKAMKRILTCAMLSSLATGVLAADPPAETQPARRDPLKMQLFHFDSARHAKMENAAFLGVATSPATAALTEQLKLQKGIGLVVDFVEPKSPGDEAGLKQYDVLQKLNDQLLIDSHQFAVLVRTFKPGDEVTITVVHQGETRTVKAKLIEREVAALDEPYLLNKFPNSGTIPVPPSPPLLLEMNGAYAGGGGFGASASPQAFARWVDANGSFTWTRDNRTGVIVLQETDKEGKKSVRIIHNDEDLKKLPPELRDRIVKMQTVVREHRPVTASGEFSSPATQPVANPPSPETH